MNKISTVLLMHGYIGFGKTTIAKKFEELGFVRYTHDEWVVKLFGDHQDDENFMNNYKTTTEAIYKSALEDLKNGKNIILDFGFWNKESRVEVLEILHKWSLSNNINISPIFVNVQCDMETARLRCINRDNNRKDGELWVPVEVFDIKSHLYSPITIDEINEYRFEILNVTTS